jgi:hypothetical protein
VLRYAPRIAYAIQFVRCDGQFNESFDESRRLFKCCIQPITCLA